MAQDATHVRVGLAGHVYSAPLLSVIPADVTSPFAAAWLDHGYCTDDGVGFTDKRSYYEIKPWGNRQMPVRRVVTDRNMTIKLTLMQSSRDNDLLIHGGGVWSGATGKFVFTPSQGGSADLRMFAVEWVDGNIIERIIASQATVIDVGEVVINGKKEMGYSLSIALDVWIKQSNDVAKDPLSVGGGGGMVTPETGIAGLQPTKAERKAAAAAA